jgi:hypothetical protein
MSPEDRKALGGIVVGIAWGGLTMAGPLAFPNAPQWVWQGSFALAAIVVLAGLAVLAYDFFIRPKGKRLEPFIATAIVAMIVALVSLGIFLAKGPQIADRGATEVASGQQSQPEIALIAPEKRHEIIWDPTKQLAIVYGPEGQTRHDFWKTPIFHVKTLSGPPVQDATVTWQIEITAIEQLVKSSSRLSKFNFDFGNKDRVTISGGGLPSFIYNDVRASQGIPITFITANGAEAFIPSNVFANIFYTFLHLCQISQGRGLIPSRSLFLSLGIFQSPDCKSSLSRQQS